MNLLQSIFLWILYSSLTATIIIIFVLFLKKLIKNHLDLSFYNALWLLVIIRLLLPFTPESPVSFFNIFPERYAYDQYITSFYSLESDSFSTNEIKSSKQNTNLNSIPIKNQNFHENNLPKENVIQNKKITYIASYIWFLGVLFAFLLIMLTILAFNKKTKHFTKINDPEIIKTLNLLKAKLRIHKNIALYYEENTISPYIAGFINPKIYLSKKVLDMIEHKELHYILLHELIHYKRKDLFYNLLETTALILHWFNPLVWFAVKKMRLDRELTCDRRVLENLEEDKSAQYGLSILKLSSIISKHNSKKMFPAYFYENKHQLERRIMMIKTFKKGTYKKSIFLMIMFLLFSPIALTNAQVSTVTNENQTFSLSTPSHFNTLERALDFVDFDFKIPDVELKNYIFDCITLNDDVMRIKFSVRNVVDTSAFTLIVSPKEFMENIKKNPYETYTGSYGEKNTKEVKIEPMTISNIKGMCLTLNNYHEWTEESIQELQKKNTKNEKYIPTIKNTLKYFIWQDNGIWYGLEYYFENSSYYGDTSTRKLTKEDLKTILSSLKYTKDLKNTNYISKAWEDTLYIYGNKDLKQAKNILGFMPKFPLELPEEFMPISANTGIHGYSNKELWVQLETLFKKKNDPTSEITFVQTQSTYRYDFLKQNGYDRETKTQAAEINLGNTKVLTFADKEKTYFIWKENNIVYTAEFSGTFESKKNIVKFLINEPPYLN